MPRDGRCDAGAAHTDAGLAGLIDCIGQPDFGQVALARLNRVLAAGSWAAYRLHADSPPSLCLSGSLGIPDSTRDCFSAYRAGLYRSDSSFERAAPQVRAGVPVVAHWRAEEITRPQREQIYDRYGMHERLSLVCADSQAEGILAVNLYRHAHQPRFGEGEIDFVQTVGRSLLACVQRHVALVPATTADPALALQTRCPALTERELQVCVRMLKGLTLDGIAADLGVSAATAKTYRNRAFQRLGIHFRNQLFDLVLPTGDIAPPRRTH